MGMLPAISITRESLIAAGLLAPDGEDFRPLAVAAPITTEAPVKPACSECGATDHAHGRPRIRQGRVLCRDCAARGAR